MKTSIQILVVIALFQLVVASVFGQGEKVPTYFSNVNQLKANNPLVLQNSSVINTSSLSVALQNNGTGNLNETILNQIGTGNNIDIQAHVNNSQKVSQLGNKNYYSFINYYNSEATNFNVLQQGNSNNLQIYGSNSLIDNMSIIQKSSNKTITVKNY